MAKLPTSIDTGSVRGAAPTTYVKRAQSGAALQDLAQGVEAVGKAFEIQDDRKAQELLREEQGKFEPVFQESAARYDGRESGFASSAMVAFDDHFKTVLEREDIPSGVRLSLRRQVDQYKGQFGRQAIAVEGDKRAGIIADQERVKEAQEVGAGFSVFQKSYGEASQKLYDDYDGSQANLVPQQEAAFEAARQAALAATPENRRAALEVRLAAQRPQILAQAMEVQDKGHTAYVASQVKATGEANLNSVLTNPAGYAMAASNAEDLAAGLPASMRKPFLDEYRGRLAGARIEGLLYRGDLDGARTELDSGAYDKIIDPARKQALLGEIQSRAAKRANDLLEAYQYGGDVSPSQLSAAANAANDPGLKARADFAIAVGAGEMAALAGLSQGGGKSKGFQGAVDFIIDKIEGGDALVMNDNGRGLTRFGINQTANPDLDVRNLTRGQAVGRFRRYWNAIGGERLPPALALVAFDAAVNHGEETARKMLAQSGGDVGTLLALREARYRELAKSPQHADDLSGWMARLGKVRSEAVRLQQVFNLEEGLSSDPLKFALGSETRPAIAAVPPLPEEIGSQGFELALQGRLQVGRTLNQSYRAPLRLLTNAEAKFYGDMIARDPSRAVDFAETALRALGPQQARNVLGEINANSDPGVGAYLAQLASMDLGGFARQAAKGLALKGQGGKLEPPLAKALRDELSVRSSLFAGQGDLRLVVENTAEAAMLADRLNGVEKPAWAYVNSALGATNRGGRVYGGVGRLNGKDLILPPWLAADQVDEAMDIMAEGFAAIDNAPVYSNGQPIPADKLKGMTLQMAPNGRYRLQTRDGAWVQSKSGQPFDFDWSRYRDYLRSRLGRGVVQR